MSEKPGLAWPDHDSGPTPPPEYRSREREDERRTRKPLAFWDRAKFLLLLGLVWVFLFANTVQEFQIMPLSEAARTTLRTGRWVVVLALVEALRQLHYLVAERWSAYYRAWNSFFGIFNRRAGRMNDWNRFRLSRVVKVLFYLFLLNLLIAAFLDFPVATALLQAPRLAFDALPFALRIFFILLITVMQFAFLFWFLSRGGVEVYFPDDIKTRFTDVWGQDSVLSKVKENMVFLDDPESIERRGGYVPGGILLWGPPGTGKTLMAEAVAGETGKPFMFVEPGAFINMFMGVGILKVKSLFRRARKLALRYGGVIMFLDEADSLGSRGQLAQPGAFATGAFATGAGSPLAAARSCHGLSYLDPTTQQLLSIADQSTGPEPPRSIRDRVFVGTGGGGMGTLNALLTELSGLKKPRGFWNRVVRRTLGMRPKPPPKYRILVIMATNLPQALDDALLRPGRIDRIYKVGYPSKAGRIRTYQGYLDKVQHGLTDEEVDRLATITPYATGASMKDLVNEALINAIRAGRDVITWRDIVKAKQLKDLGPPEDVEYIERERHAVAVHEACHAVVAYRVRHHLTIDIATIEKGGNYLGMVASIPPEDQFTRWRSEYEADIMVSLASLAGERMFFSGDNSSGVSGDLESATWVASFMEGYWGMGETVFSHAITRQWGIPGAPGGKGGEDDPAQGLLKDKTLGARIEVKLAEILKRAETLLAENRREVLAVAHALETHKTVTGEDVEAVIDGTQGPLIDGRPYHTDEFLEAAESYHALVVTAHQAHGKVEAPMPELRPVELVGAARDAWHDGPNDERASGSLDRPVGRDGADPGLPGATAS
ncbi:MAG: AAA family ATPase [Egibacteraceae bacterium]